MARIFTLFICIHFFSNAFSQQVKLMKSAVSSGGMSAKYADRYSLNHTIGQPCLINSFHSSSTRLLQGFQHPSLYNLNTGISITGSSSVYPNPSTGKVFILWDGEVVTEQVEISLFDLQGKLVDKLRCTRDGRKIEVDFKKVVNGAYDLIVQGKKSGSFKVLLFIN